MQRVGRLQTRRRPLAAKKGWIELVVSAARRREMREMDDVGHGGADAVGRSDEAAEVGVVERNHGDSESRVEDMY